MSLPVVLVYGEVSIYRIYNPGVSGMSAPPGYNFGLIDQVSPYGSIRYGSPGQSVLFKGTDIQCKLTYSNNTYSIIPQTAIILIERPV